MQVADFSNCPPDCFVSGEDRGKRRCVRRETLGARCEPAPAWSPCGDGMSTVSRNVDTDASRAVRGEAGSLDARHQGAGRRASGSFDRERGKDAGGGISAAVAKQREVVGVSHLGAIVVAMRHGDDNTGRVSAGACTRFFASGDGGTRCRHERS
jgi:hypothetical protein